MRIKDDRVDSEFYKTFEKLDRGTPFVFGGGYFIKTDAFGCAINVYSGEVEKFESDDIVQIINATMTIGNY